MSSDYIFSLKQDRLPVAVGGKAYYLHSLMDKGFQVPETYVCTWQAYDRYLSSETFLREELKSEIPEVDAWFGKEDGGAVVDGAGGQAGRHRCGTCRAGAGLGGEGRSGNGAYVSGDDEARGGGGSGTDEMEAGRVGKY